MGAGKHHRSGKQGEAQEGILKPGKAGEKCFSKYCLGPAVLLDGFVSVFMEKTGQFLGCGCASGAGQVQGG